jgi:hypothetical protein
MGWTLFCDMHSGGLEKTEYSAIIIEGGQEEARSRMMSAVGIDPNWIGCECCGENFFGEVYESFEEAESAAKSWGGSYAVYPKDWVAQTGVGS